MAAIDEIVQVQISVETATIDKAGFGVPLIAGFHNAWPERVRAFGSLTELTDAGLLTTNPIYVAATKLLSQEFKVPLFKVGKRLLTDFRAYTITPLDTVEGTVYDFNVAIGGGLSTNINHVNGAAETVATIVTAITSLIDAVTDMSATDGATDIGVLGDNTGEVVRIFGFDLDIMEVQDVSSDAGIVADLTEIEAFDANWYGLLLDAGGQVELLAAAGWAQARIKLFGCDTSDADNADPVSETDTMFLLNSNSYSRTYCLFDRDDNMGFGAAAWMGDRFPTTPGSSTWKFKDLAGVTVDNMKAGERTAIRNKKGNFYHRVSGAAITEEGFVSSGQFIDVIRGIDWLQAEVQVNVFAKLASAEKVPFTDAGVDSIRAEILRALNQGITNDLLSADPAPTVTAPKVADVSPADKGNRLLPDIEFTTTLAGAVHKVIITGKVSV